MLSEQAAPPGADSSPIPLQDRIGNIFEGKPPEAAPEGAPEPEATSEPAESTAPAFEEVEYEGETYQVPPKLKEAIVRHADYTRKTQETAQQHAALAARDQQVRIREASQAFEAEIAADRSELSAIDAQLKAYDGVDWRAVSADDRQLHILEMNRLEKLKKSKEELIGHKREQFTQARTEAERRAQADVARAVSQMIPGWNAETNEALLEYAQSEGIEDAIPEITRDARFVKLLWKAQQYDRARTQAQPAVQQAKAARVASASANPMRQQTKEYLNYRKAIQKSQKGTPEHQALVRDRIASKFGA